MQATHPLLRAPYLPLKAVSPASYTGCCWKKGSLNTCQLIDGVEGASLDRHCCNAPPSRQRALASVLSVPCESTPHRHLHAFLRQCLRCRDCYTGLYKDPRCVWNGCGKCFFGAALLLYLDLLKSPHPPPSTVLLNTRGWLYNSLSLSAYYVFNESLTVFKRNRQVSEWQITPMHRQALDDYHGKLTTG